MQTTGLSIQEASRSCNHQQRLFYKVLNKVFNTYSLCHFTLFIMTQLVYLNVLISLYEFNIWLDGYIWWKFCVNSPLRNPLTDKNADVSNTYFPRCMFNIVFVFLSLWCISQIRNYIFKTSCSTSTSSSHLCTS